MQLRPPAEICRRRPQLASQEALEEGRPNPAPPLGSLGAATSSQPMSLPLLESPGNPHRWLPYVDHRAVECSPAQVPPRTLAPFVSRQLSNNC